MRQLLSVTQIIDDQGPGFTASANWAAYSGVVGFQNDFCYSLTGSATDAATWTFQVTPGQYRIAATWAENPAYWSTKSPFTILDDGIARGVAQVNQRQTPDDLFDAGKSWEQLGGDVNIAGSTLTVRLTNANDGYVIADAIRIERVGDLPAVPDMVLIYNNGELASGATSIDYGTVMTNAVTTKSLTVLNRGGAPLELSSIALPRGFSLAAPLSTTPLGTGQSTTLGLRLNSNIPDAYSGQVTLISNDPDQSQFRFSASGTVRPVQIIDDGMAGFQAGSAWTLAQTPLAMDGDVRHTIAQPGAASNVTTWTFNVTPGKYRVSATWYASPFFATNATYSVLNGATPVQTVLMNQRQAPNDLVDAGRAWENVGGIVTVTGSTLVVRLSNFGNGFIQADAIRVTAQDNISNLRLVNDTGRSSTDSITTRPTVTGTVAGDQSMTGMLVSFDINGDGASDALASTDSAGRFTYTPTNLPLGARTIRARSQRWNPDLHNYIFGDWASLNLVLQAATNLPLTISSLTLLNPTGGTSTLPTTYDPTLTGKLTNDGPVGSLKVEFDFDGNGTVDAFTRTDATGAFTFRPAALPIGQRTVRARALEWDAATSTFITSNWKSLTFRLDPTPLPVVSLLKLAKDDGELPGDRVTTNPRLTGKISAPGELFGFTVEFDHNSDGVPEGTALTDLNGDFNYYPHGLQPGNVTVQARVRGTNPDIGSQAGPWTVFTFTLVAETPAEIVGLRLLNDTGDSDTDSVTSDPRLTGQVLREGTQARFSVEFDHDGDGDADGAVMTDLSGSFRYTPLGLKPGLVTVYARAAMWNADTSSNLYGDWSPLDFTLEAAAVQGNGTLAELDDDAYPSAAVAYRRALEAAMSVADSAVSGAEGLPGVLESLLIGSFTPFAVRAAGLTLIASADQLFSRNYMVTLPVEQTYSTDTGSYTVTNTVTISYVLDVLDGAASGPFNLDVSITADLLYDETGGVGVELFNLHLGGNYDLTFHASGNYDTASGLAVFFGSYSADELGNSAYSVEQSTTSDGPLIGSSSRVITGQSEISRHESGDYDDSGSTGTYTLTQIDNSTFSYDESGSRAETLIDEFTSESSTLAFANQSSGATSMLLTESGSIGASGVTGSYSLHTDGFEQFSYTRSGGYEYAYHDDSTTESSSYTFSRGHTGASSYTDTETATFNAAGVSGHHTSAATATNSVDYESSGTDGYHHADAASTTDRSFEYSESSSDDFATNISESIDFSPAGQSGNYNFTQTGARSSNRSGAGSDTYGYQQAGLVESNTREFTDSDVAQSSSSSNESGSYTPTSISGQFGSSLSSSRVQDISTTVTSDYAITSADAQSSAANSYTESVSRTYQSNGGTLGTFDASGYSGVRQFAQTASGSDEFSGFGNNAWAYEDADELNSFGYTYEQSGSASFNSSHTEASTFSPDGSDTLFSSSSTGQRNSSFSGSGASSRRYSDEHVLDTSVESVTETVETAGGFTRTEAGTIGAVGRFSVIDTVETGSETHETHNTGTYTHRFEDSHTLETKNDSIDETRLRGSSYSKTQSDVVNPSGVRGGYEHSGHESDHFSYTASGDSGYSYHNNETTIDNSDSYSASGLDNTEVTTSDAGTHNAEGRQGLSRRTESSEYSDDRAESGSSSYHYASGNVVSTNHSSYTNDKTSSRDSSSTEDNAYTPTVTLTARQSDLTEETNADFSQEGDSYYADLLRTIGLIFTNVSHNGAFHELHNTNAGGPDGSSLIVSELRTRDDSQTLTDTWTLDGESTSSTFTWSNSTSTPYNETSVVGTPPATPLQPPATTDPSVADVQAVLNTVNGLAAAGYSDPENFVLALSASDSALQSIAVPGSSIGVAGSSDQWFGAPEAGSVFMLQAAGMLGLLGAAGNVTPLSPWEAAAALSSVSAGEGYLAPVGSGSSLTPSMTVGAETVGSPMIVGRERPFLGVDIFTATDNIPTDAVGSYLQFRSFGHSLDSMTGGMASYTSAHEPSPFSPAWGGLGLLSASEGWASPFLTPLGPSAVDVQPGSSDGASPTFGLAGSMVLTTAPMSPADLHTNLAFMDFSPRAADLMGLGRPTFVIGQ